MAVEGESVLILAVRMLGRTPSATERQEPVLELLEGADRSAGRGGVRPGGNRGPAGAHHPRAGHRALRWAHAGAGCRQG